MATSLASGAGANRGAQVNVNSSDVPLRVLIIDDDPERIKLVEEGLAANAVVHTASRTHGRLLLDMISRIGPDVIIMDCNSPDRDTIESLRLVARSNPKPIVMFVEEEGGDPRHTVLCHMNPSHMDPVYQATLAQRGALLEFDMIGMDFFYADQGVQCPSDDEAARAILGLVEAGFLDRILLSQDVFVKMMLTRYGGNGYAFVTKHFLPRLLRHGLDPAARDTLMVTNPRRVFDATL